MEKTAVERTIWIPAPREKVWQAITDPAQIAQWFVPNLPGALMKSDDSGKITIFMGPMGVDFVTLEVIEPLRELSTRSLPDQLITCTYTLEDQKEGTQIKVSMTGFDTLPEDAREDRLHFSSRGWEQALENLKAYIEGRDLPFPQAFVGPLFGYWREPRKKLAIERSIWINAPRERVWSAVTDPKQIQQWYSPNTPWELSALEVGGRFYIPNSETKAEMYVEIIEILDSPHQLVTRNVPEPPDTVVKIKVYLLKEENGGTRLTLTHVGYEPEPEANRWNNMEQNAFGFGMMLGNLKAYLEGTALPFPFGF